MYFITWFRESYVMGHKINLEYFSSISVFTSESKIVVFEMMPE